MSQAVPNPPPGFDNLSTNEKLEYIESLWDKIVESSDVPIPDWHRALVRERLDAFRGDSSGRSWAEVRSELVRKHRP